MSFLDQSNDPDHPRNFMHWHTVPVWLHWLCTAAAAFSAAFGGEEVHVTTDPEIELVTCEYDLMFFRLHHTASGKWYFKAL